MHMNGQLIIGSPKKCVLKTCLHLATVVDLNREV